MNGSYVFLWNMGRLCIYLIFLKGREYLQKSVGKEMTVEKFLRLNNKERASTI